MVQYGIRLISYDIYVMLTLTRSKETEFPGSRPLAICAISWTRPPFERMSHFDNTQVEDVIRSVEMDLIIIQRN